MYHVPPSSPYVPCPRCQNPLPTKVTMSWWGGIVGPKMVNLVKCPQCKLQYNGKTGASVSKFIVIYVGAWVLLFLIVVAVLFFAQG
ncbi:MAG TPA: hypothetical protein DEF47_01185 [Herpetosiphon sp.]|nr:hypothetical protein [Herpetosiphon sp.]